MTREDHEEAHFFAFVTHNTNEHWPDKSKWSRAPPCGGTAKPPRRIGNHLLTFKEYRPQHDGCWICYGKNLPHKQNHKMCKIYAEDKKAYFQAHPKKVPKDKRMEPWKRGKVLAEAWEDKGMEVTAQFNKSRKWPIC